jgi:predicted nucleic acid-binding protein
VIVADANLLVHAILPGELNEPAEKVFLRDPEWCAPMLWRSEFRNVLAGCLRRGDMTYPETLSAIRRAEAILGGREYMTQDAAVMQFVRDSRCTAYDCEYVALAAELGAPLVTADRKLLNAFPKIAVSIQDFSDTSE